MLDYRSKPDTIQRGSVQKRAAQKAVKDKQRQNSRILRTLTPRMGVQTGIEEQDLQSSG